MKTVIYTGLVVCAVLGFLMIGSASRRTPKINPVSSGGAHPALVTIRSFEPIDFVANYPICPDDMRLVFRSTREMQQIAGPLTYNELISRGEIEAIHNLQYKNAFCAPDN